MGSALSSSSKSTRVKVQRAKNVTVKRLITTVANTENPAPSALAISPDLQRWPTADEAANINGPSLVRVPDFVPSRLGNYYLYFAHHSGKYIRMAYADDLKGPWTLYKAGEGVLHLRNCKKSRNHIASPDVHIDFEQKTFCMFYHSPVYTGKGQYSFMATSKNGLLFSPQHKLVLHEKKKDLPEKVMPYLRVFRHPKFPEYLFALGKQSDKGHVLYRLDGIYNPTAHVLQANIIPRCRHTALLTEGNDLYILYSRIGDAPESILMSKLTLREARPYSGDLTAEWSDPKLILQPVDVEEGVDLPVKASDSGESNKELHQLRDPCVYTEVYLDLESMSPLPSTHYIGYSVKGEKGIRFAKLSFNVTSNNSSDSSE